MTKVSTTGFSSLGRPGWERKRRLDRPVDGIDYLAGWGEAASSAAGSRPLSDACRPGEDGGEAIRDRRP